MAKDVTIRVTGQNPDGTMTVQQVDGGNPFAGGGGTTAMTSYNPQGMAPANQQGGYRATFNGVSVVFASEADFLKADRALREMLESQAAGPALGGGPTLGGRWGGGETTKYLRAGGEGLQAVSAFLHGRGIKRKIEDFEDAIADSRDARNQLDDLERAGKYPDLVPVLRRLFLAERDATEAAVSALDDQQQAADLQAGGGVAKVFAELLADNGGAGRAGGGDMTTALAVGGGALGLGLLLSSRDDNRGTGRRRRGR